MTGAVDELRWNSKHSCISTGYGYGLNIYEIVALLENTVNLVYGYELDSLDAMHEDLTITSVLGLLLCLPYISSLTTKDDSSPSGKNASNFDKCFYFD